MKLRKSDATRERILDAANTVLRNKSYFSTRLADIAKAAGTHAGPMYYYFSSKDALVEALLHRNAWRSWKYVEDRVARLPAKASHRDRVICAARSVLSNQLGEAGDEAIVYMQLLNQIPPEMRARMITHAVVSRRFIRDLIRDGQRAGEFRDDVNPTVVALMLLSNLIWSYDWFRPASRHAIDELANDLCHVLLAGIEKRTPAARRTTRRTNGGSPRSRTAAPARPVRKKS